MRRPSVGRHILCHMVHPYMTTEDFRREPGKATPGSSTDYVTHTFALVGMRMGNQQVCLEKSGTRPLDDGLRPT